MPLGAGEEGPGNLEAHRREVRPLILVAEEAESTVVLSGDVVRSEGRNPGQVLALFQTQFGFAKVLVELHLPNVGTGGLRL